jgi:tetratricopeptide (TPR) repeat protein
VAVDPGPELYKQSPQHEEAGLNIHRVPTIIVYKNGKELQRIVESPVESLEQDLLNITTKSHYNARFELVAAVDKKLKKGVKKLKRAEAKLLKTYKGKVSSLYELNTYAKVLRATGKNDEALAVLELNTKIFPKDKRVYISLSQQLLSLNRKQEGILALEQAITLAPNDQALKARLVQIKSK